ncbi:MAG TPA: RHS repeat-associated core domain-containing protein, partial [Pirellulales bacterium]|nr:RHS repeat-associated core domain-containing protein [Pirellulales bacterium]
SVDQSGFTVAYFYDSQGRLEKLTDGSGNPIVQYTYNDLGQLSKKQNGNGASTVYAYDPAGALLSITNLAADGKTVNSSFTYTYNLLGEVTSMVSAAGTTTYGYDATGQLTQVGLPNGTSISYAYNAAGDRTQMVAGGTTTSYQSNADNEITHVGAATYAYDKNGNLQSVSDSSGTTTYDYNDLNQLLSITAPDGTVTNFQYSPLGFMVGTSTTPAGGSASQTNYLVDPTGLGNVVGAYTGSGSLIADYTYGLGLVSQVSPGGTGYYDFDLTGNTIGITGASGSYVNQYSYLPFGETTTIGTPQLPNPFTFGGQFGVLQIGANLFDMRARDYTPVAGQFLSNDPIGIAGQDANVRRYVGNSPTTTVDPEGTFGLAGAVVGGAVGALANVAATELTSGFQANSSQLAGAAASGAVSGALIGATDGAINGPLASAVGGAAGSAVQQYLGNNGNVNFASRSLNILPGVRNLGRNWQPKGQDLPQNSGYWWLFANYIAGNRFGSGLGNFPAKGVLKQLSDLLNKLSKDPNAMIGPGGYGTQNFVQPTGAWPYTVDFENDGGVAAQDVTVSDQLDPNFDWSTFQLGSFGFGSVNVSVPAGLTQYQTTVPYQNVDGSSLNVAVALDFNVQTGKLTATFTSLDPATGQPPTGVTDGFLPPDDSTHVGEGYVQYTVQPKANLATGATIDAAASVVFDINAPVVTKPVTNTIDAGPPTSSVNPLPASENSTSFTVSWSGSDAAGPGIAGYNVDVSDNGGPFTAFQTNTTATSATFTGVKGHTYAFYSLAIDPLGLTQPTPTAAQATTTVATVAFAAIEHTYVIGSGTVTVSAANGLLTGDTAASQLAVTAGTLTGAQGGSFVINADGSFAYTPGASFPGYDSAQFTVTDTSGDKGTATVNVLSQHAGVVWKFYESVLNREPDPDGLKYWTNYFNTGGNTGDMAFGFFESDELLDKVLGNYYEQYLLRPLDANGLTYWKGVWHATGGPEQIKAGFAD